MNITFNEILLAAGAIALAWLVFRSWQSIVTVVILAIVTIMVIVPFINNRETVIELHEDAIKKESRRYARAAVGTIQNQNSPVIQEAKSGRIDLVAQREAMLSYSAVGRQQVDNEAEAINRLHGRTFGQVHMPVTTDVDEDQPLSWYDTGKDICGPTRIEVWGTATHDPPGYPLFKWVGPLGWQEAAPEEESNFRRYSTVWRMLEPDLPFMAALGRLGGSGHPFLFDEQGPERRFQKTVNPGNCKRLWMAVNGFTRVYDPKSGLLGFHISDLARQRKGGFEVNVIPLN